MEVMEADPDPPVENVVAEVIGKQRNLGSAGCLNKFWKIGTGEKTVKVCLHSS